MSWDFSTEAEFQAKLDWMNQFVREEVEPLDVVFPGENYIYDKSHPVHAKIIRALQAQVKERGLWACHLGPELGGVGFGQLKLGLMNEILGRSGWAPTVFGCQAPDSGNAEILAHYGTEEQKRLFLEPLLASEISSCYSMTEPQAGSDPGQFKCRARREGDEWVLQGEKWFSSCLRFARFAIVMAVTDPDVPVYQGTSMFLVPTDTPGINILRHTGLGSEAPDEGNHAYVHYDDVRVPAANLLGGEGQAFAIAQTRLGGGRIHHAMRTVGMVQRCFDMMCERALSRQTQGEPLAKKQMVQDMIAESWIQLHQFRLQVLHAAWTIDNVGGAQARLEIAGVKVALPRVYRDVATRTIQVHGSIGVSNEMPLTGMVMASLALGLADGPTEVHKITVARQILKTYHPHEGLFPREHLPARREAAMRKFGDVLEHMVANL